MCIVHSCPVALIWERSVERLEHLMPRQQLGPIVAQLFPAKCVHAICKEKLFTNDCVQFIVGYVEPMLLRWLAEDYGYVILEDVILEEPRSEVERA